MKLYIAPNEKKTAGEVSEALGKTTRLSLSDSYSQDGQGMLKRSVSRRNEERPLMTPDEVRRLDPDKIILIPERQNPILVDRIVYWQDAWFKTIIDAQKGPLPYPDPLRAELEDLRAEVMALKEDRISYLNAEPTRDGAERSETEPPLAQEVAEVHSAEADDAVIEEANFRDASDKMDSFDKRLQSKTMGGQEQADPT
jgi:type IV secretion system protein VirD4